MKFNYFMQDKTGRRAIPILILSIIVFSLPCACAMPVIADISNVVVYEDDGVTPTDHGQYDDTIIVKGVGATSGGIVKLGWDSLAIWDGEKGVLNATDVEIDGSFEVWFYVPEATNGTHYIWLKDVESGDTWGGVIEPNSDFNVHAKIKFDPSRGLPDDKITIKGYGFDDEEEILEMIFGTPYWMLNLTLTPAHPETDELGSWVATFRVPDLPYGDYYVEATQRGHWPTATKLFTISPTIALDVEEGPVGTIVEIWGRSFTEGVIITTGMVTIDGTICFVTVDDIVENGKFKIEVVIPSVPSKGEYDITVDDGIFIVEAEFEVVGLPEIVLEPTFGAPGSTVNVHGFNFTQISGEEVSLELWDHAGVIKIDDIDEYETDSMGEFSGSFIVPAQPFGVYTIMARQEGHDTTNDYNINGSKRFRIGLILIVLSPTAGPTGTLVHLTGVGFTHNEEWNATFDGIVIVEHGWVYADGTIDEYFFVPTVSPGVYTVTACDIDSEIRVEADFEVTDTTTVILIPGSAPNEYNVTVEGMFFSAEEGTDLQFVLWNATDDWYMDVWQNSGGYSTPVETDADGSFIGWWEVPDDMVLSLGEYTVNVTDDNDLHTRCTISIVDRVVKAEPRKTVFFLGETLSFLLVDYFKILNSYIEVKEPYGSLYWRTDNSSYHDWVRVGHLCTMPYQNQTSGGKLMHLSDDAPLGIWSWTWYEREGGDVLGSGTFMVSDAAPGLSIYSDMFVCSMGDTTHLGLNITNYGPELNACVAIWIEKPGGGINLIIHAHSIMIPAGLQYSNPILKTILLPSIPTGLYTWHVALLNPSTHGRINEDTAIWVFI